MTVLETLADVMSVRAGITHCDCDRHLHKQWRIQDFVNWQILSLSFYFFRPTGTTVPDGLIFCPRCF